MIKRILPVLCLILVLLLTGCSKTAVTTDTFIAALEDKGYVLAEVTDSGGNPMLQAYGDDTIFSFLILESTNEATRQYNVYQSVIESLKGAVSSHASVNMGNHNSYSLTTNGFFYYICRIDDTILMAETPSDSKDDVQQIIKDLGY